MQEEFKFNDKTDYIFYLSELITDCCQKTDRLKRYQQEIEQIILANPNVKLIQTDTYESINDKVRQLFQYIFNLLGDESNKAVSFRKFRKRLYNDTDKLNIKLAELPQNESKILEEFNTLSNWGLHIPESQFIQKKGFLKLNAVSIEENKNTIAIQTYDYFEIQFLTEMKIEIQEVTNSAVIILERMKNDYSLLIGEPLKIKYEHNQRKPYLFSAAVQNSWGSQHGKIKK